MKKIAFLSSCVRGGGAGWSLYFLIKHLDRSKYAPVVIVPAPGIYEDKYRELDVPVVVAPNLPERSSQQHFKWNFWLTKLISTLLNTLGILRTIFWLKKYMQREQIDLVYANNMMVKSIGAFAAKLAKKPCVLHIRNLHEKRAEASLYGRIARINAVKMLISNSTASAVPFQKYAAEKIRVVHNGIDLNEYSNIQKGTLRSETGTENKTVIGYTGNIIPRKGIDILLKAAAPLLKSDPECTVVIVGRVPIGSTVDHRESCQALADDLGISAQVIFTGFREDVRPYVQDMDILVLPSRQEPFGRSIVEAMALGVPVVASRVGGIPEIITSGKDGILFPVEDIPALTEALRSLLEDKILRKEIGENARETIVSRFDVKVLSEQIQQLLAGIV